MTLRMSTWDSYVLQIHVTCAATIKPDETRCIRINLAIEPPASAVVCICRDADSFFASFFTFIEEKDLNNVPIYVQNISSFNIDLMKNPIIINCFAFSIPNLTIEPISMFATHNYEATNPPHGSCESQIILYGDVTKIRTTVNDLKWSRVTNDDVSRNMSEAVIWINIENMDARGIKDSVTADYISDKNICIEQVLLFRTILIVKIIHNDIHNSRPPTRLYVQLSICHRSPHIRMHHNDPSLVCKGLDVILKSPKDVISSVVQNSYLIYKNTFTGQGKYAALFIANYIYGLSINTFIWHENKPLRLTIKGLKRNINLHRDQTIGKLFFLPIQNLAQQPNPIGFGWDEISTISIYDSPQSSNESSRMDIDVPRSSRSMVTNFNISRPILRSSNIQNHQEITHMRTSDVGTQSIQRSIFRTNDVGTQSFQSMSNMPTLSVHESSTHKSDITISLQSLNISFNKQNLVPLRFTFKSRLNKKFNSSPFPETLTILSGTMNVDMSIPRSLKRGYPAINNTP